MNIIYLSTKKRWGGVMSWMVKTAEGLERKGHAVHIISHPRSRLFTAGTPVSNRLVRWTPGFLYNPFAIFFVVRFIRKHRIDLLVANTDKEVGIGGIAARLCGIPCVRRIGSDDDLSRSARSRFDHQWLVRSSIVPCDFIRDTLVQKYRWLQPSDFTTIYNGRNPLTVPAEIIGKTRAGWGIEPGCQVVGITGQLKRVKHVEHLIDACSRLWKTRDQLRLVVTGEGPERERLKQFAESSGKPDRIVFAGYTAEPLVHAASYDIAVLASKREGFPNTLVEYFAAGTPVVASDVGGVREIVTDGVTGFTYPYNDIDALAGKLGMLLDDKRLRESLARGARQRLMERFSEDAMIDNVETFFREQIR